MNEPKYFQFCLRIAPPLMDKLRYIANQESRSINKQIERLIIKNIEEFENSCWEITQEDIERVKNRE